MTENTPHREVDLPGNVYVRCPLKQGNLRKVQLCEGCQHFHGLTERFVRPGMAFSKQYQARCSCVPIDRELFEVEI